MHKEPLLILANLIANFKGQICNIKDYDELSASERQANLFYNENYELIAEIENVENYKTYKDTTGVPAYLVRKESKCDFCHSKSCHSGHCEHFAEWEKDRSDIAFAFYLPMNIILLKNDHSKLHTDKGYKKIESEDDFINNDEYYAKKFASYLIEEHSNVIKMTAGHLKKTLRTYELLHMLKEKFEDINPAEMYKDLCWYNDDSIVKVYQSDINNRIRCCSTTR